MRPLRSCLAAVGGTALAVLLLFVFVAPAVYVELEGRTASGVIVERREEISVRNGDWSRTLRLVVRYTPADTDAPEQASIAVTPARYDRAREGDTVAVRYMPRADLRALGEVTAPRLADQGPLGQLAAQALNAAPLLIGVGVWGALFWAWTVTRRGWLLAPLALMMLGAGVFLVSDPPLPGPPGPRATAEATVREVFLIDRLSSRSSRAGILADAMQPYQVVALEFVPAGWRGPVVAVDLVDVGSVAGLEQGGTLAISYSTADPRWARIEGAARTYAWKNLYVFGAIAGLCLLVVLGLWARGWWRARRAPAGRP